MSEEVFCEGACMVFDTKTGNAFHYFDYTPEALEEEARKLREAYGEVSTITVAPSPFVTDGKTTA